MAKKSTVKKENNILSFVDQAKDSMEGFEDITTTTMAIPFLKILQSLSPQLKKNKPEYIQGAEEGMFFNTVSKELYGFTIHAVALKFEQVYIEWKPDRGGFINYHTPEHAYSIAADRTFGNWKTAEGNDLQENYIYYILLEEDLKLGVMILALNSSNIKEAKKWNRLMTTHIMDNGERAMPYYLVWKISSVPKSNEQGDWYGINISFDKYISEEIYNKLKGERKALPERQVDYTLLEASSSEEETEF